MIPPGALDLLLPDPGGPGLAFRWATVMQTSPLRVRLDGEDAALPITPDTLLSPAALSVGTRVRVEVAHRRIVVHGAAGSGALARAVNLGANRNLDTVTEPGHYYQGTYTQASVALNYPEAVAGLLEVIGEPSLMLTQRYTRRRPDSPGHPTGPIWQRSFYSTTGWTEWALVFYDAGIPSYVLLSPSDLSQTFATATQANISGWTVRELFGSDITIEGAAIRIQRTGLYAINASLGWAANISGERRTHIARGGSTFVRGIVRPATSGFITSHASLTLLVTAGQYLSIAGYQNSGGNLSLTGSNYDSYATVSRLM